MSFCLKASENRNEDAINDREYISHRNLSDGESARKVHNLNPNEYKEERKRKYGQVPLDEAEAVAWKSQSPMKKKARRKSSARMKLKIKIEELVEERLTVKQIFKRYVQASTLHGFLYTCLNTYIIRRLIWSCLMIAGALYFLMKLHDGLNTYYRFPFSTTATLEYTSSLSFPAISFCPVNQFKVSALQNSSLKKLLADGRLPISSNWTQPDYDIPGEILYEELKKASFSVHDLHAECDWISRDTSHPNVTANPCGAVNFTSYFSADGNLCFTLNSASPGHPLLKVDHSGIDNGYEIHFHLKTNQALHQNIYSGMKVIIHDQNEVPVFKTGFVLPTGFYSFIELEKKEINNLPPPYATKCGSVPLKFFKTYHQEACHLELLTNHTSAMCKCRDIFMPDNGLPLCSFQQMTSCMMAAKASFNKYDMYSKCPIDCHLTAYDIRLSDSHFLHNPPKGIEPVLLKRHAKKKRLNSSYILELKELLNETEYSLYLKENVLVALFYYGEMSKTITEQVGSYNFYKFLGDIGGTFGLMLGASLLTFFEFIDLFAFLLYHQLLRLQKRHKLEKEEKRRSMAPDFEMN